MKYTIKADKCPACDKSDCKCGNCEFVVDADHVNMAAGKAKERYVNMFSEMCTNMKNKTFVGYMVCNDNGEILQRRGMYI